MFCRCETFNSYIRAQNIFGNKSAPSHDIAWHFAVIEQLRYICEDGHVPTGKRCYHKFPMYGVYIIVCSCGRSLKTLYGSPILQHHVNEVPMREGYCDKGIYQPGALRKVLKDWVLKDCSNHLAVIILIERSQGMLQSSTPLFS